VDGGCRIAGPKDNEAGIEKVIAGMAGIEGTEGCQLGEYALFKGN